MSKETSGAQSSRLLSGLPLDEFQFHNLARIYFERQGERTVLSDEQLMALILEEELPLMLFAFMEKYPQIFVKELEKLAIR